MGSIKLPAVWFKWKKNVQTHLINYIRTQLGENDKWNAIERKLNDCEGVYGTRLV